MKKTIYSSFAVLATAFAFSCNKEINTIKPENENGIFVTINTGKPDTESSTKTEMFENTPYWSVGDVIGVSDGTGTNTDFNTAIVARATTASFTGTVESAGDYYAYFPYTSNGVGRIGSSEPYDWGAKFDLPVNQYPTATSFDGNADIMVSKKFTVTSTSPTVDNLEFARLGAIVKIVLIDTDDNLKTSQHPSTVSMTAESNLAGRVLINMKEQCLEDPYYNPSTTVTANYTAGTKYEINGTNATYLIVVPQTLAAGSTLTFTASTEDYSIEKEITVPAGGIPLAPGKITTLKVNLASAHITTTSGAALPFIDNMAWADNGASDSPTDIGSSISSATNSNGLYLTGTKAYKGKGGLKLGTGSANGSITTKELNLSGGFNIAVKGASYGSDGGNLVVSIDGTEVINESFSNDVNYVNIPSGTYTKKSKVTIGTSVKRGYLYSVKIKSGTYTPDPVINVTSSNPLAVDNTASSQTIEYSIVNPTTASLTAVLQDPADTWISNIDYSTEGKVSFNVAAQSSGDPARSAVIVLSYTDAADVEVTVNQAEGPGAKTQYTATLTITSGVTSNTLLTDDKGNSWTVSAVTTSWTPQNTYIQVGAKAAAATSISLSSSAFASVDIKEVHVWAGAKANTNVTTKISIDSNLLGTSGELGNQVSSGTGEGTEYYITNTSDYSGNIDVVISRPSSAKGAIYFKKLTVVYEE